MLYKPKRDDIEVKLIGQERRRSGRVLWLYVSIHLKELFCYIGEDLVRVPPRLFKGEPHISLVKCKDMWETDYLKRWMFELAAKGLLSGLAGDNIEAQLETSWDGKVLKLLPGCQLFGLCALLQTFMLGNVAPYRNLHLSLQRPLWKTATVEERPNVVPYLEVID